MRIFVECPHCHGRLFIGASLQGRKFACPGCQAELFAPADGGARRSQEKEAIQADVPRPYPAFPQERYPEAQPITQDAAKQEREIGITIDERARWRWLYRKHNWRRVRTGVTLVSIAILTYVVAGLLLGLLAMIGAISSPPPWPAQAPPGKIQLMLVVLLVVMLPGAWIVELVGNVLCLEAPAKFAAKSLAIATLVFKVFQVFCPILAVMGGPGAVGFVVIFMAHIMLFHFYLLALARCLGARQLETGVVQLIVLCAAIMVISLGIGLIVGLNAALGFADSQAGGASRGFVLLLQLGGNCTVRILSLIWLIRYVQILLETRSEIEYSLYRR